MRKNISNDSKAITDWQTRSSGGFSPLWKPSKEGETIEVIPQSIRYQKKHGRFQEGAFVTCKLLGGTSNSFFQKDVKKPVTKNGMISVALSYNLSGDESLAIVENHKARLSKLSEACKKQNLPMRIVFDGKIKGGQGSVKLFTLQTHPNLKF